MEYEVGSDLNNQYRVFRWVFFLPINILRDWKTEFSPVGL